MTYALYHAVSITISSLQWFLLFNSKSRYLFSDLGHYGTLSISLAPDFGGKCSVLCELPQISLVVDIRKRNTKWPCAQREHPATTMLRIATLCQLKTCPNGTWYGLLGIASAERNRKMSTSKPVCARPVNLASKTWQRSMPHCLPCRIGGRPHWSRDKPGWNSTRPMQKENPKEGCTSARSCGNRPEMQISELVLWKPSWDICLNQPLLVKLKSSNFPLPCPY